MEMFIADRKISLVVLILPLLPECMHTNATFFKKTGDGLHLCKNLCFLSAGELDLRDSIKHI